ncbi:Selenocysteine lyase [Triplophysa tibetana]|uniref:Selenocysteine lyase n=1 Tax=Triplophysa tibetana TaxID=1572043 RepID=A0A5A9NWL8_9TELE|nr:Selenocysteine lyase [Triplophysa tibetana]
MVGGKASDIIFTSGGTEANNLVFHTAVEHFGKCMNSSRGNANIQKLNGRGSLPHIITSNVEHDSIKVTAEYLLKDGKADVTFVPVSKVTARVEVEDVLAAIRPNTCLVSVMLANNETGIIMPIKDICLRVKEINKQRSLSTPSILLHTDAAQAIGKIRVNAQDLGVDYITIVGHKFYGPRIGALFVNDPGTQTPVYPMLFGGAQERNFRPGLRPLAGGGRTRHSRPVLLLLGGRTQASGGWRQLPRSRLDDSHPTSTQGRGSTGRRSTEALTVAALCTSVSEEAPLWKATGGRPSSALPELSGTARPLGGEDSPTACLSFLPGFGTNGVECCPHAGGCWLVLVLPATQTEEITLLEDNPALVLVESSLAEDQPERELETATAPLTSAKKSLGSFFETSSESASCSLKPIVEQELISYILAMTPHLAFSTGGNVVTSSSVALKPEMVNGQVFLARNL